MEFTKKLGVYLETLSFLVNCPVIINCQGLTGKGPLQKRQNPRQAKLQICILKKEVLGSAGLSELEVNSSALRRARAQKDYPR